jgi:murein DD-endopeptidase MepM/ murein hydrolase activator NlpD
MFRKLFFTLSVVLLSTISYAQPSGYLESALEMMADTSSWSNAAEYLKTKKITIYPSPNLPDINLDLKGRADSLYIIPSYANYQSWDTQNIWHKKRNVNFQNDSALIFQLIVDSCDFAFPTDIGRQTSPFGPRWGRLHAGLDLDLDTGDPVYSMFEGLVRISQFSDTYGNVVVVRHPNGLETLYAHMSARMVVPGQYVQAGNILGLGGNTGRSYGAHLHFETRFLGNPFDPAYLITPNQKALKSPVFELTKKKLNAPTNLPSAPNGNNNSKGGSGNKYHTVKRGDTLSSIAVKNKTTVSKLCKLNKIKPKTNLKIGQKIRVR